MRRAVLSPAVEVEFSVLPSSPTPSPSTKDPKQLRHRLSNNNGNSNNCTVSANNNGGGNHKDCPMSERRPSPAVLGANRKRRASDAGEGSVSSTDATQSTELRTSPLHLSLAADDARQPPAQTYGQASLRSRGSTPTQQAPPQHRYEQQVRQSDQQPHRAQHPEAQSQQNAPPVHQSYAALQPPPPPPQYGYPLQHHPRHPTMAVTPESGQFFAGNAMSPPTGPMAATRQRMHTPGSAMAVSSSSSPPSTFATTRPSIGEFFRSTRVTMMPHGKTQRDQVSVSFSMRHHRYSRRSVCFGSFVSSRNCPTWVPVFLSGGCFLLSDVPMIVVGAVFSIRGGSFCNAAIFGGWVLWATQGALPSRLLSPIFRLAFGRGGRDFCDRDRSASQLVG